MPGALFASLISASGDAFGPLRDSPIIGDTRSLNRYENVNFGHRRRFECILGSGMKAGGSAGILSGAGKMGRRSREARDFKDGRFIENKATG